MSDKKESTSEPSREATILAQIFGGKPADYAPPPKREEIEAESDWLTSTNSGAMLYFLQPRTTHRRKPLLFGVACCGRIWDHIINPQLREVVDVAERFADGDASDRELRRVTKAVRDVTKGEWTGVCWEAVTCLIHREGHPIGPANGVNKYAPMAKCGADNNVFTAEGVAIREAEKQAHATLIREVFTNPFRPVSFSAEWRTSDVLLLAEGIYAERAFDRMPILADALQDAGCDNEDILIHLRDANAEHVRGCWALDLILGKE